MTKATSFDCSRNIAPSPERVYRWWLQEPRWLLQRFFHITALKGRCLVTSQLIAHAGARVVTLEELERVEAPPSTDTWFPIRHSQVLHSAIETLGEAGFQVQRT